MFIDAHHHLWNYNEVDYSWMDESMDILKRDYLPSELAMEMEGAGVEGTVVVQARQILEETYWLLEMAEESLFIKGVVGWVDLRSENLEEQLNSLSSYPKLVGVRHVIQDETDDDFMLRADFLRGIEQLGEYGLCYDLLLFPKHLRRAVKLVSRFPEQNFVLDHISKPQIKSGILHPWKKDIEALATQPNVWCKISGLVTEAHHREWKYEDFIPYMDVIVDAFGTGRIMLGSDWPVCRLAGEYKDIMDIPKQYFSDTGQETRELIYHKNVRSCYRL